MKRSYFRVVHVAAAHSRRYRLSNYHLDEVPSGFVDAIGSELVDLFEQRHAEWRANASSGSNTTAATTPADPGSRERQRGQ